MMMSFYTYLSIYLSSFLSIHTNARALVHTFIYT